MEGTTHVTTHKDYEIAVVLQSGKVVLMPRGGAPHRVMKDQTEAEKLVGKLEPYRKGTHTRPLVRWPETMTFNHFERIEAASRLQYGEHSELAEPPAPPQLSARERAAELERQGRQLERETAAKLEALQAEHAKARAEAEAEEAAAAVTPPVGPAVVAAADSAELDRDLEPKPRKQR